MTWGQPAGGRSGREPEVVTTEDLSYLGSVMCEVLFDRAEVVAPRLWLVRSDDVVGALSIGDEPVTHLRLTMLAAVDCEPGPALLDWASRANTRLVVGRLILGGRSTDGWSPAVELSVLGSLFASEELIGHGTEFFATASLMLSSSAHHLGAEAVAAHGGRQPRLPDDAQLLADLANRLAG